MEIKKKILIPIERENFKNTFCHPAEILPHDRVIDYYLPVIASLEKAAANRYFWSIVDFVNWTNCGCGGDLENLTPLKKSEFVGKDLSALHRVTHPDDLPKVFAYSRAYINILENFGCHYGQQLRVLLYFRLLNVHSEYYWIMVQYSDAIMDSKGKIQYGLVFVTDISHIKKEGMAMMSIFDVKNQKCEQFYCIDGEKLKKEMVEVPQITSREKQILSMIAKGFGSKQIADILHIAVKTVDNHRQNMLKKTSSNTSSELISIGIRLGII